MADRYNKDKYKFKWTKELIFLICGIVVLIVVTVVLSLPTKVENFLSWDRSGLSACVHGFIDDEKTMITLPCWEKPGRIMKGWHSGSGYLGYSKNANNTGYLGFEMCEFSKLSYKGGATFEIDEKYKADTISGWLQKNEKEVSTAEVNNIFKDKPSIYKCLADINICRGYNPLENPMWNKELSEKLLEGIDFISQDAKSRQGLLYKYGKMVAEANGWTYNEEISKLNSNSGQLRYIFDSSLSFVEYPIAYISIDMEGPDLAFELCDKRGKHKGECSWDGKIKKPQQYHDIKVKR